MACGLLPVACSRFEARSQRSCCVWVCMLRHTTCSSGGQLTAPRWQRRVRWHASTCARITLDTNVFGVVLDSHPPSPFVPFTDGYWVHAVLDVLCCGARVCACVCV